MSAENQQTQRRTRTISTEEEVQTKAVTRRVFIKRLSPNKNVPEVLQEMSVQKVGSSFTEQGDYLRGLSLSDEKEYLPSVLGIDSSDPSFVRAVQEFWKDFSITIPSGSKGLELNVSLDENGKPVNLMDYIRYNFARKSPLVANEDDRYAYPKARFYMEDPDMVKNSRVEASKIRMEARKEFITSSNDLQKLRWILKLAERSLSPGSMDEEDVKLRVEELVEKNPTLMLGYFKDQDLEMKYFVLECLSANVIEKVGNAFYDGDQKIGDSLEEAVLVLNDKKNSTMLIRLKERLKVFS